VKNAGERSTHLAQEVFRRRPVIGLGFGVFVDREATLSGDLSEIEHRTVRDVSIVLREGFADEQRIRLACLDDVIALRDGLTAALDAMQHEWFRGERVGGPPA
jgi:hypothetical protein